MHHIQEAPNSDKNPIDTIGPLPHFGGEAPFRTRATGKSENGRRWESPPLAEGIEGRLLSNARGVRNPVLLRGDR